MRPAARTALLLALALLLTSCAADGDAVTAPTPGATSASTGAGGTSSTSTTPAPAREGREAAGARITFVPDEVLLPDGSSAPVRPAVTRDGVLEVPVRVDRVGWWDGSAHVGDPYGSTVLAGHVDSSEQGLGVFAALLDAAVGDEVRLAGQGYTARYRVTEVEDVRKESLAPAGTALDQTGPHRLVLITCTGDFDPVARHYDQNRVVVATPVGAPAATG